MTAPSRRRFPRILSSAILTALLSTRNEGVSAFSPQNVRSARSRASQSSSDIKASRDTLPSATVQQQQPPYEEDRNPLREQDTPSFQPISLLLPFSLLFAVGMVAWEDYGAANLWPSRHMIAMTSSTSTSNVEASSFGSKSIRGLAFGKSQRIQILQEDATDVADASAAAPSSLLPEIRAYNEVMEEHRLERISRWQEATDTNAIDSKQQMEIAVGDLQQILLDILKLQALVSDYQWSAAHSTIQSSITPKLEPAATVLRRQLSDNSLSNANNYNVGYEEIGFDWGSCAWRHCGALADAQEALDELDHLLGVLEPPECLFCLNVAERSIRDMLAVVPASYHALDGVPEYVPYQRVHKDSSDGEFGEETELLDQDYLRMLKELRNTGGGEEDDE